MGPTARGAAGARHAARVTAWQVSRTYCHRAGCVGTEGASHGEMQGCEKCRVGKNRGPKCPSSFHHIVSPPVRAMFRIENKLSALISFLLYIHVTALAI